jgi:DNA-directed RNA polymerase specialized sigma24 family protein
MSRIAADRELRLETLVAVARSYLRAGLDTDANRVLESIAGRLAGRIHRHLQVWGVRNADDRDDLVQELLHMTFSCIRSQGRDQEFWECRFWVCFDRRSQSLLRDWRQSRPHGVSLDEIAENDPDILRAPAPVSIADRAVAREALARLPEPLRTAFLLKHLAGYKEESRDASEPTIARSLGVTGRTVRNYLDRAAAILADTHPTEAA